MRTGVPILPEELIGTFVVIMCVVVVRKRYCLKYKKEYFSSTTRFLILMFVLVSVMILWLFVTQATLAYKVYQDNVKDFVTRVGKYFKSISWLP